MKNNDLNIKQGFEQIFEKLIYSYRYPIQSQGYYTIYQNVYLVKEALIMAVAL